MLLTADDRSVLTPRLPGTSLVGGKEGQLGQLNLGKVPCESLGHRIGDLLLLEYLAEQLQGPLVCVEELERYAEVVIEGVGLEHEVDVRDGVDISDVLLHAAPSTLPT